MALRIGAILLASCQLISGAVISLDNVNNVHLNPIRPIQQAHEAKTVVRQQTSSGYYSHQPSVVVSSYIIGQNAVKASHVEVDSNHINVNKNPVIFNNLKYIDYNQEVAKTPITVVTVPSISTAKPTQHKVAPNQVINQSNIPSVQDQKNPKAVQLLYSYNDYSSTSIYPLAYVPEFKKTPIPNRVQSELVKPGKLQKVVAAQLAVSERNENAPIVISQFLTTKVEQHNERNLQCESNEDNSPYHHHRVVIGLGH